LQPVLQAQQNMNVECFALHARNLIEFLKDGDDCGFDPTDFTTDGFAKRLFIRSTLVKMMNDQISHLSSDRTENDHEKFGVAEWLEATNAIQDELRRWTSCLTPDWAAKWENRERMDEAAASEIAVLTNYNGASSAPLTQIFGGTGAAGPASPPEENE